MLNWTRRNWFLFGIFLVLAAAALAPNVGKSGGPLAAERWREALIASIFLISGLELRTREIGAAARDFRLHIFVQGVSLGLCPLLFYGVARALAVTPLPRPLLEGIVVLGCLSTTVTSGVAFTRASGGDEAGALLNASLGNLLGVIVTPWLVLFYTGRRGSVSFGSIALGLAAEVAAPFLLGQVAQAVVGPLFTAIRPWFGRCTMILLLALIYFVFCDTFARGIGVSISEIVATFIAVAALHGATVGIALWLSAMPMLRFSRAKRTAAVICASQKTAALGLPLVSILHRGEATLGLVALPLLLYHPLQLFAAGAATGVWRKYNAQDRLQETTMP